MNNATKSNLQINLIKDRQPLYPKISSSPNLNKLKKIENGSSSNNLINRETAIDKSINKSDNYSSENNKVETQKRKSFSPMIGKFQRNKTVCLNNKKGKNRVKFKKNFVTTIVVESYKKYNVDMSFNDIEGNEGAKCRCLIF